MAAPTGGPAGGVEGFRLVKALRLFLTVGSQMPFDRLVVAVARWARDHGPGVAVMAQVGQTTLPAQEMQPLDWAPLLAPKAYRQQCDQCDLMIAHAGMGSVLTALECDKPLLVMPRRGPLRETRNDHQLDTVEHLLRLQPHCGGWPIQVARDEREIPSRLDACIRSLARAAATRSGERGAMSAMNNTSDLCDMLGTSKLHGMLDTRRPPLSDRERLVAHLRASVDRLRRPR